ncbi:DUF2178 domain-containing protein [Pyrococcus sp. ST04]|uniref:DUF2178 domain-containing protein n=1 Tax=Pyrococcus sp. ST04 TaxID=1183377 RepID=UPI0002605CAC|nr:DUF2178 domain-containing protein [Pyrococcus sp. ST04]AFK22998.1 hypothetical protein Py04_1426 [Pyrococcus sp. ST04]
MELQSMIVWIVTIFVLAIGIGYLRRKLGEEKESSMIVPVAIIGIMGYVLGLATARGNLSIAFAVLIVGVLVLNLYYTILTRRGHVLSDERTLRIEEISSRRTLQVFMLILAFIVVYLSVAHQENQLLKPAFILSEILLAILMAFHIIFRFYYSRVM